MPCCRQLGAAECERLEDALLEFLAERVPGHLFDDEPERDVVGVGVGPLASRREEQGPGGGEPQRVDRPDRRRWLGLVHPGGVVGVIGQAGAVLEKLTDGDRASGRYDAGQVAAHGIIQADSLLIDELEHQRGRERLRYAPDPEPLASCRRRCPGGGHGAVTVVRNENDHASGARAGKLPRDSAGSGWRGCARPGTCASSQGQCGHRQNHQQHSPAARSGADLESTSGFDLLNRLLAGKLLAADRSTRVDACESVIKDLRHLDPLPRVGSHRLP